MTGTGAQSAWRGVFAVAALGVVVCAVALCWSEERPDAPGVWALEEPAGRAAEVANGEAPQPVSRTEARSSLLVVDEVTRLGLADCSVDFIDATGALLGAGRTDSNGRVELPTEGVHAAVAYASKRPFVGVWLDDTSVIVLGSMPTLHLTFEASEVIFEDFELGASLHYEAEQGLQRFEFSALQRRDEVWRFSFESKHTDLPSPLRSRGEVVCHGRHRGAGIEVELGRARFEAGAKSVRVVARSAYERRRGWVGVRVHLPVAFRSGQFSGRLVPWSGPGDSATGELEVGQSSFHIASLAAKAGEAMLHSLSARDDSVWYHADNLTVDLVQDDWIDVAPWEGGAGAVIEIEGVPNELLDRISMTFERVVDEFDVPSVSSRRRLDRGGWVIGHARPGTYSVGLSGLWTEGYRFFDQRVVIDHGKSPVVTFRARRYVEVKVAMPEGARLHLSSRTDAETELELDSDDDTIELPAGEYLARFTGPRGVTLERLVELLENGVELDFR